MTSWIRWVILSSVVFGGCVEDVCETHVDCPSDQLCVESGGVLFGGKDCVPISTAPPEDMDLDAGEDVSIVDADNTPDIEDMGMEEPDASEDLDADNDQDADIDMPCVPITSAELCLVHAKTCGEFEGADNCGHLRTVDCGTCVAPAVCGGGGTPNTCACAAQSDEAFCNANNALCGIVEATDDCNQERMVNCGACVSPQSCGGGGVTNVCGCSPEDDDDFCARLGKNCGLTTGVDNCGTPRSTNCGLCLILSVCIENVCSNCVPESDADFCNRNASECGTFSGLDNCGMARTTDCGTCANSQFCSNDTVCTVPTECGDNEYVSVQPSATSDRECAPCAMGTSSVGPNASACLDACEIALGLPCAQFEEAHVRATHSFTGQRFGHSVALYGDTLVVGTPNDRSASTGINGDELNSDAQNSGAVFVFTRTGSTWTQQAFIKASNTNAEDSFGFSVSVFGDTLAVGAPAESSNAVGINGDQLDNSAESSGAVCVFTRTGSTWSQQAYLKASNTQEGHQFGFNVSLDADILAVSAPWEGTGGVDSGAAYVFTRNGNIWSQEALLKASNAGATDRFGISLQVSGDTLAVGAPYEDSVSSNSGAVYVFTRSAGAWSEQSLIKPSVAGSNDLFGSGLTLDGDILAVGAPHEDSNATGVDGDPTDNSLSQSGAAYVFVRSGNAWTQEAYIKASNTGSSDRFGESLALSGDTLAVGAAREDSDSTGLNGDQLNDSKTWSGAVYLFQRVGGQWSQTAYIKASNTGFLDYFGSALAVDSDTLAIGAYGELADNGAVYIRRISP